MREQGDRPGLSEAEKRLSFARWLVEHGYLGEGGIPPPDRLSRRDFLTRYLTGRARSEWP